MPTGVYARRPLEQRFWAKVDQTGGPDACWPWVAARTRLGYGVFGVGPARAHRVSFEMANGVELEKGAVVMHTCDNPPCVNPAHLRLGSVAENDADRDAKGRLAHGERLSFSKLTAVQAANIRLRFALGEVQ